MHKNFTALLMVILCLNCGTKDEFVIAFNTWVGYGPFFVAEEKGFFEAEGVKVRLQIIEGTGERRAAMISNRIDALGSTVDDFVVGLAEGLKAKMVLGIDRSEGADGIIARKGIEDITDFRGKRIAVLPGFVNHFYLLYLLDKNNIKSEEVIIVPLEPDKAPNALVSGAVDIAVTWEPHLSVFRDKEGFNLICTTRTEELPEAIIMDNLIVSENALGDRSREVQGIINAWFKALNYMESNPSESEKIIGEKLSIEPDLVREMLSGVRFLPVSENKNLFDPGEDYNVYEIANKAGELYQLAGIISDTTKLFPIKPRIETTFVENAQQ